MKRIVSANGAMISAPITLRIGDLRRALDVPMAAFTATCRRRNPRRKS